MAARCDVFVLPRLRAQGAVPFLVALAPHFALAARLDLRLRLAPAGSLIALYPRPEGAAAAELPALRARLAAAFEAAGRAAGEIDLPAQLRVLEDEPDLTEGVLAAVWQLAQPQEVAVQGVAVEGGAVQGGARGLGSGFGAAPMADPGADPGTAVRPAARAIPEVGQGAAPTDVPEGSASAEPAVPATAFAAPGSFAPSPPGDAGTEAQGAGSRRRAVLRPDAPQPEATFAALVRRSCDASFLCGGAGSATLLDLETDPGSGASLEALRAAGLPPGVLLLHPVRLAAMTLWLPEGLGLDAAGRGIAALLLSGLADAGLIAHGGDLHFLPPPPGDDVEAPEAAGQVLWLPPAALAAPAALPASPEELAAQIDSPALAGELGPALRFRLAELIPDAAAQAALNARLNDRRFPLGYRISLAPVGEIARSDESLERLRAEIDEREARIALIAALGRPQLRLLRFTDAQLPALVDGLRKMPPALRAHAGLRYGATHAAGRPEAVHYVLYDPETVQFEGLIPEFYWRGIAGDEPISFWLDPHAEEARDGDPGEPLVFVPQGQRILPYIDSFGGPLSGTLRLVLGSLFADGSAVLEAPGAAPAFVFAGHPGGTGEIAVELVDTALFRPLAASLRWINEHILAASPRTADPEALRELAETLYAGQLAQDLRRSMRGEVAALAGDWAQAEAELLHSFRRLTGRVADEVEAVQGQLAAAQEFAALARARLGEVTRAMNALGAEVGGLDSDLCDLASGLPALAAGRLALFERFEAEAEAGRQLMQDASAEAAGLSARMQALLAELERR